MVHCISVAKLQKGSLLSAKLQWIFKCDCDDYKVQLGSAIDVIKITCPGIQVSEKGFSNKLTRISMQYGELIDSLPSNLFSNICRWTDGRSSLQKDWAHLLLT